MVSTVRWSCIGRASQISSSSDVFSCPTTYRNPICCHAQLRKERCRAFRCVFSSEKFSQFSYTNCIRDDAYTSVSAQAICNRDFAFNRDAQSDRRHDRGARSQGPIYPRAVGNSRGFCGASAVMPESLSRFCRFV
jgi:hypothetical protein